MCLGPFPLLRCCGRLHLVSHVREDRAAMAPASEGEYLAFGANSITLSRSCLKRAAISGVTKSCVYIGRRCCPSVHVRWIRELVTGWGSIRCGQLVAASIMVCGGRMGWACCSSGSSTGWKHRVLSALSGCSGGIAIRTGTCARSVLSMMFV